MHQIKIEQYHSPKRELTNEDQILLRRQKTAERVRRYRERKKNQQTYQASNTDSIEWIREQRTKATERMRRYRQRKLQERESASLSTSNFITQLFRETLDGVEVEENIEDRRNGFIGTEQVQLHRRQKERDPLELVKADVSTDETKRISQISRIEEIIVGIDESAFTCGHVLGPNIHGVCYCVKKKNEIPTPYKSDYADATNFIAEHGDNIFRRKCMESNCRGCAIEVVSPIQRLELPHKNLLRCVSDYCMKISVLDIANQKGLPKATYSMLCTLTSEDLAITEQQFTRMWRSILLQRVQQVQRKATCMRVPNMIPLTGRMLVPAPLSDLLCSIGRFHSTATGVMHHTFAPEKPATDPMDWWTLDDEVTALWIRTMHTFKDKFVMRETSSGSDFDNKPLMMTQIEVTDRRMVQCMAKTTEIGLTDGYVHMVNDPLYNPSIYSFEECHLIVSSPINQDYLRTEYVSSYVINEEVCF